MEVEVDEADYATEDYTLVAAKLHEVVPAIRDHENICEASHGSQYYEQEDLGDDQGYPYRYSLRNLKRIPFNLRMYTFFIIDPIKLMGDMPPQEYRVIFFGTPRIAESNEITVEEGQIMGSTILARKMTNNAEGNTFVSDGAKNLGGVRWGWPPLEEPVWGRVKDVAMTPRSTSFTLEIGVHGAVNLHSESPEGEAYMNLDNIYIEIVDGKPKVKLEWDDGDPE